MFYKIKNSQLEEIGKREILERDVQRLVEANLDLLFGLEFVDTELSIENVRFDTLAFDKESNAPIIIEFKKTFEKSLFDQGLEYLNILFSRKADFTITLHKKIGISPDPDKISWENAKVIFVGNRFSERQKRAVSFQGLPIELWSFEWLENDFFKIDRETLVKEASLSEFAKSIGSEAIAIEKVRREIKEYDRDYHKNDANPKIWELFEKVENGVKDFGDFEVRYRKLYICFYGKQSFFVVKLLKSKLQVEFGKEKDAGIFKEIKGVHDITSKQWNHAFMFEVESEKDLDSLLFILKKASELL
jgi:predicted transport protein